jgi:hypothetical protein
LVADIRHARLEIIHAQQIFIDGRCVLSDCLNSGSPADEPMRARNNGNSATRIPAGVRRTILQHLFLQGSMNYGEGQKISHH